jgi:hypothetical protein
VQRKAPFRNDSRDLPELDSRASEKKNTCALDGLRLSSRDHGSASEKTEHSTTGPTSFRGVNPCHLQQSSQSFSQKNIFTSSSWRCHEDLQLTLMRPPRPLTWPSPWVMSGTGVVRCEAPTSDRGPELTPSAPSSSTSRAQRSPVELLSPPLIAGRAPPPPPPARKSDKHEKQVPRVTVSCTSKEVEWRENTVERGLRPPPFFQTWLQELLERLQCRSTPLFLVADSFPGASVESLREGCKIVILSILNSSSKITLKLKL